MRLPLSILVVLAVGCPDARTGVSDTPGDTATVDSGDSGDCVSLGAEVCDGLDNNCDGVVDDGFAVGTSCDGVDLDRFREGLVVCDGLAATLCTDPNEEEVGSWEPAFVWPSPELQTEAVHLLLLPNGQVLSMYHGSDVMGDHFPNLYDPAILWNPATGEALSVPVADTGDGNLFCAGHNHLGDGRSFFTGGDITGADPARGETFTYTFDGAADPLSAGYAPWAYSGELAGGARWYPTNVSMADGSVLIASGAIVLEPYEINETTEVFLPAFDTFELRASQKFNYMYPWMHLLPDGRILVSGQEAQATRYDPSTDTWEDVGAPRAQLREYGTSTLLMVDGGDLADDPDVLVMGGCEGRDSARCCLDELVTDNFDGCDMPDPEAGSENWECFASAELLTGGTTDGTAWVPAGSMAYERGHAIATLLPDGNVFVSGGERNDCTAPPSAELYHTEANVFSTVSDYPTPYRGDYHTTAMLLPDGRVLVTGGDSDALDSDGPTAMIFRPPYLDLSCCAAPVIVESPESVAYGAPLDVRLENEVATSLVFMRLGAVTHDFNQDQRGVTVNVTATSAPVQGEADRTVSALAPRSSALAPPGTYLLFAVSEDGVPSEGVMIELGGEECSVVVCEDPPPSFCVDEATLKGFGPTGACYQGVCQYSSALETCTGAAGTVAYCEAGTCVVDDNVDVAEGETTTLAGGDYVLGDVYVAGELVLTGPVTLQADSFVVGATGTVRCEAYGATSAGVGGLGGGTGSGAGGGGGAAGGAGGLGGISWSGHAGGIGGAAWLAGAGDCAEGSGGGNGGGGSHFGPAGGGGGLFAVLATTVLVEGAIRCDGAQGGDGEYDDGAGGGGSGGCISILGTTVDVASTAVISAAGAAGGIGGYCDTATCGELYCGGGGGGGGGGATFFACSTCELNGVVTTAADFLIAMEGNVSVDAGGGGAGGSGSEGACSPAAEAGVAGGTGVFSGF